MKKIKFLSQKMLEKMLLSLKVKILEKKFKKYVDECINLKKRNLYE